MTNWSREFRRRDEALEQRLEEAKKEPCEHRYIVGPAISVVPTGKPCALCGEPYEAKK